MTQKWKLALNVSNCAHFPQIQKVDCMGDLGIKVSTTYTPSDTVSLPIQKAQQMLFYLKRAFLQCPVLLPPLHHVCSPSLGLRYGSVQSISQERHQMDWESPTACIPNDKGIQKPIIWGNTRKNDHIPFEWRRPHGNLIFIYCISRGEIDMSWSDLFLPPPRQGIRNYSQLKVFQQHALNRRRQSDLTVRIVPFWNKLQL